MLQIYEKQRNCASKESNFLSNDLLFFSPSPSQSSTRIRSGGGRRWSTCIKRWNVATLSPRRRGDTARPIQGDRRKPRERRRSPKSRRVGGAGKSSVLHPKAQRRRQAVEHMHQAVERRHALPQAEDAGGAAYEHATRRVSGSVAGVDQNPLASRHLHQARQSRPPSRRPSAGRAGKAWRNHVEAQDIFARGNGRMRPRSGRFERGHGRLSALGGKKQHPLRTPGQVGGAAQTNQCGHLEKIDVVNEIRAPLAAPVTNIEGVPPEVPAAQPQTARHGGARKSDRATLAAPVGNSKDMLPEAPAAQPQLSRHGGSAKALSAHPAAPVGNSKACPPKPPPHNRKPRGTAGARKPYRPSLRRPSGTAKASPPEAPPHNRKARGTAGAWKEAEGHTPTAGRGMVRRPAACIGLSPLGAVPAHAAQQSVGRLRTALRQGGIASLARDNPIGRLRVQRPRLRRHRPLSGVHRPFGEG